jgi:hypothetical protein
MRHGRDKTHLNVVGWRGVTACTEPKVLMNHTKVLAEYFAVASTCRRPDPPHSISVALAAQKSVT